MKNGNKKRRAACLAWLLAAGCARAEEFDSSLLDALHDTRPLLDLRLRSDTTAQTGFARDTQALLLRARLGFQTGKVGDTSLLAEASLLTPLVDDYNSGLNGKTAYPSISDPRNYELHRLQLENTSLPQTDLVLGRQRVPLDDQRFVGASNWRMNENTLDSLRIVNTGVPDLTVDLTYYNRFNRRTTEASTKLGALHGDSYLANVRYATPWAKITVFDYLLSFREVPTLSSRTAGVRLAGEQPAGPVTLAYTASWARQSDYSNNPVSYSDDYRYLDLKGTYRQFSLTLGTEVLGGNGTIGLSTPMASFHSWDGWAGAFTTTPVNGLNSRYSTLGYSAKPVSPLQTLLATATYYDFHADRSSQRYGSELDLQLQGGWRRFTGLIQFADFASANTATMHSSRSLWVEVDYLLARGR
ncbi:MAG TPA: hypothetical protein VGM84_25420 [Steroidobacteraceae bacterium]